MPLFEGEDMDIRIDPDLSCGESLHVLVTHDESLFHANDGRRSGWGPEQEQPMRKKGQGRAIHVSEFLCEALGRLKLRDEQCAVVGNDFPTESQAIIHPGTNHDGFWNVEQLVKQVRLIKQFIIQLAIAELCFKSTYRLQSKLFQFLKECIQVQLVFLHLIIHQHMQHLLLMP